MKTKQKPVYKDYFKFIDEWRHGITPKFKAGDVVEIGEGSSVGVVQFPMADVGIYQVKKRISDKPWEYLEIQVKETCMKKSNLPNPFKYNYSDMVPGPSSKEIDVLNARMALYDEKKKKEKTAKEVDAYVSALEDEMGYKKEMKKIEDKDKVVSDEDDDVVESVIAIDPIEEKREKIISEE